MLRTVGLQNFAPAAMQRTQTQAHQQVNLNSKADSISFGANFSKIEKLAMGNNLESVVNLISKGLENAEKTLSLDVVSKLTKQSSEANLTLAEKANVFNHIKEFKNLPEGISLNKKGEILVQDKGNGAQFIEMWQQLSANTEDQILPVMRKGNLDEYSLEVLSLDANGQHMALEFKPRSGNPLMDFKVFMQDGFVTMEEVLKATELKMQYSNKSVGKGYFETKLGNVGNWLKGNNSEKFEALLDEAGKKGINVAGVKKLTNIYKNIIKTEESMLSVSEAIAKRSEYNNNLSDGSLKIRNYFESNSPAVRNSITEQGLSSLNMSEVQALGRKPGNPFASLFKSRQPEAQKTVFSSEIIPAPSAAATEEAKALSGQVIDAKYTIESERTALPRKDASLQIPGRQPFALPSGRE